MTSTGAADRSVVIRHRFADHAQPWRALKSALDERGHATAIIIEHVHDVPEPTAGAVNTSADESIARHWVVDALRAPDLVSLVIVDGESAGSDDLVILVLSADVRWASPDATIRPPQFSATSVPYAEALEAAVERMGRGQALAWWLGGHLISAEAARQHGLIDEIIASHDMSSEAGAFVQRMESVPRDTLAEVKALLAMPPTTSPAGIPRDPAAMRRRVGEAQDRLSATRRESDEASQQGPESRRP